MCIRRHKEINSYNGEYGNYSVSQGETMIVVKAYCSSIKPRLPICYVMLYPSWIVMNEHENDPIYRMSSKSCA